MLYEMNSGAIAEQVPFFIGVPGNTVGASFGNYVPSGEMAVSTWANDFNTGYLIPTNTYRIILTAVTRTKIFSNFLTTLLGRARILAWPAAVIMPPVQVITSAALICRCSGSDRVAISVATSRR